MFMIRVESNGALQVNLNFTFHNDVLRRALQCHSTWKVPPFRGHLPRTTCQEATQRGLLVEDECWVVTRGGVRKKLISSP